MAKKVMELKVVPEKLIADRINELLTVVARDQGMMVTHISIGWAEIMGSDCGTISQINIDFEKSY